jgi:DNA polymerase I-like protein with 3'-5' exonuclease and polymerase domains
MTDWEFKRHYALLKAKTIPACQEYLLSDISLAEWEQIEQHNGRLAIDFETSGLRWMDKGFKVRSVALVNDNISMAIDLNTLNPQVATRLWSWLANHTALVAHNATFEAGVIFSQTGKIPDISVDTRAMAYALAGEGSPGQSWGLKALAKDLLGAETWNEDIDITNMMSEDWAKVGKYNQIDTHYTWHLYLLMSAVIHENSDTWGRYFMDYHQLDVMNMIKLQVEAYANGLSIETEHLEAYSKELDYQIASKLFDFHTHPKVLPGVQAFNEQIIAQYKDKMLKNAHPTKSGKPRAAYESARIAYEMAKHEQHFNINSNAHLTWLIYDYLGLTSTTKTDSGGKSVSADALAGIPDIGKLILEYREPLAMKKFVTSLANNLQEGKVRIPIRAPGTVTGRCSAGEI